MENSTRLRFLILTALGVAAYLVLLHVSYDLFSNIYIPPQWWYVLLHSKSFASVTWFMLVNAAGALLAAAPVAAAVVLFTKVQRKSLGLLVGLVAGAYFIVGSVVEYGLPKYPAAWVISGVQFLCIALAVFLAIAVFTARSLTTSSGGRE